MVRGGRKALDGVVLERFGRRPSLLALSRRYARSRAAAMHLWESARRHRFRLRAMRPVLRLAARVLRSAAATAASQAAAATTGAAEEGGGGEAGGDEGGSEGEERDGEREEEGKCEKRRGGKGKNAVDLQVRATSSTLYSRSEFRKCSI